MEERGSAGDNVELVIHEITETHTHTLCPTADKGRLRSYS